MIPPEEQDGDMFKKLYIDDNRDKILFVGVGNNYNKDPHARNSVAAGLMDWAMARTANIYETAKDTRKLRSHYVDYSINVCGSCQEVVFLKPFCWPNNIGECVKHAMNHFKIKKHPSNVCVWVDDISQPVGNFRIVSGTSFRGHPALQSIAD